ncbi:ribonuclease PH [Bdellovibrionota bacterium FG-2]
MNTKAITRNPNGRLAFQLRPIDVETGVNRYAEGSVLIKAGHTHVLCTASVDETVPPWMAGRGTGWITAEYSMLPRATHTRGKRDREKVSGRTQEIQRLIGRALRAMINLKALGERSLMIDCDVLQADGGTRTASITGASIALTIAIHELVKSGKIPGKVLQDIIVDTVSAISVGLKNGEVLVDLDYNEDSSCDVDMNFVITGKSMLVEVQGTAEKQSFSKQQLNQMTDGAFGACESIRRIQMGSLQKFGVDLQ